MGGSVGGWEKRVVRGVWSNSLKTRTGRDSSVDDAGGSGQPICCMVFVKVERRRKSRRGEKSMEKSMFRSRRRPRRQQWGTMAARSRRMSLAYHYAQWDKSTVVRHPSGFDPIYFTSLVRGLVPVFLMADLSFSCQFISHRAAAVCCAPHSRWSLLSYSSGVLDWVKSWSCCAHCAV